MSAARERAKALKAAKRLEAQQALTAQYRGRAGMVEIRESMRVDVLVADARKAYNRLELLVRPRAGAGESWFNVDAVTLFPWVDGPDPRD